MVCSLNAVPLDAGGYADDEVATVEWSSDWWQTYTGADGSKTRSTTNDFGAIVTMRYAQTANANDRLSAVMIADLALKNGAGAGMFRLADSEGRTVLLAERAWVVGPPPLKFAKTVQVYEWKIELADARGSFFGGR